MKNIFHTAYCIKIPKRIYSASLCLLAGTVTFSRAELTYPLVDTGQTTAYGKVAGQDAHYAGNAPSYEVHGDGTVSDRVTGLMWTRDPGDKMTLSEAQAGAAQCRVGGYSDWRLPSIKELYSLIQLNGVDPDPASVAAGNLKPFIDSTVFHFTYGDPAKNERIIDSQFASSTRYVSTTMKGDATLFGVNFADGRIKGYGLKDPHGRGDKTFFVLYVRGNEAYGVNTFTDNGDGTLLDAATGLTWMKSDSGEGMDWPSALAYAENFECAGYTDWRLPNAKELQSIIDYTRSPDTTDSAAIDPIFDATEIINESGQKDYAHYWTSTTHAGAERFDTAVYFAFGRALGWMEDRQTGEKRLMDVHGAGSQRSDPKVGDASAYPYGRGPQGDVIRIKNMVRLVRGGNVKPAVADIKNPLTYPVVDTGQIRTYDNGSEISYPESGEAFYGQDAQYEGLPFSFEDHGDGTVSDLNTGLMWQKVPSAQGYAWEEAIAYCNQLKLGGYDDWRIPTLKELFAISDFSHGWPYLDRKYFSLATGSIGKDEQYWCAEDYQVGTTHGGVKSAFGVNHVTGHIKAYPAGKGPGGGKHVRAVRGDVYGVNAFVDNGDGTVTDEATGLTWMQTDSEFPMEWKDALAYAESFVYAGHDDWRLPNVKELQSIVNYSGIFPAIDPMFRCTRITNEAGEPDFGYYWSSTSALFSSLNPGYFYAWYVAFGRAVNPQGLDTHGAGAVRFDSKSKAGPRGEGGERYANYVRLVRGGNVTVSKEGPPIESVKATKAVELAVSPPQASEKKIAPPGRGPQDSSADAFILRLDQNGDGKVSQAEFDGPTLHFNQADLNHDGFITQAEAPTGPPGGLRR